MASSSGGGGSTSENKSSDGRGTTPNNEDKENIHLTPEGIKKPPNKIPCDGGSDDEITSDPIVVSPHTSPVPSPTSSLQDVTTEEIFEDAKAHDEAHPNRLAPSPSFVVAGLQKKASLLSLKSWTALALTLDGRDKITKVFQYASRLLAWWFAGTGRNHMSIRFGELYKSLALSRKAFRLGRSLIEIEKLRSMGLGQLILWHLQKTMGLLDDDDDESDSSPKRHPPRTLARRASSNIGWGPMSLEEEEEKHGDAARRRKASLARSLSMKAYRAIYRPLRSTLSTVMGDVKTAPSADLWVVVGSALKMLGLFGFWAGDNFNYISSTGFLDDHSLPTDQRLEKRKDLQTLSGARANQAYFAGSVAGFFVTAYSYVCFRRDELAAAEDQWKEACAEGDEEETKHALRRLQKVKEKQFSLFLAFLKVRFKRILYPIDSKKLLS